MGVRVLVVDDHAAMRRSLTQVLESESGVSVVGEATNGDAAIQLTERLRPDVVVMDVIMPALNGIEATRRILQQSPQTIIIALSVHECAMYAVRMLRAGARAYVLKDGGAEELVRAAGCLQGPNVPEFRNRGPDFSIRPIALEPACGGGTRKVRDYTDIQVYLVESVPKCGPVRSRSAR